MFGCYSKYCFKAILITCFSIISILKSEAQPAYISVNLNDIYVIKVKDSTFGASQDRAALNYFIFPSVSYAHYLNKNSGIGIELGHSIQKSTLKNGYDSDNYWGKIHYEHKVKMYHVSLYGFEDFNWKNFYFQIGLKLSWQHEYYNKESRIDSSHNKEFDIKRTRIEDISYPETYIIGLYFQPTAYTKIYKNLYGGIKLQSGIEMVNYKGEYTHNINATLNGTNNVLSNETFNYNNSNFNADFFRFHLSILYKLDNKKKKQK